MLYEWKPCPLFSACPQVQPTFCSQIAICAYKLRQFNSRNGPVIAVFAYLCTSCCRIQNTLLVKLCTLWHDGATARNILENCFPEYLTVTSRCVGCHECQQIFVLSGNFLIFERVKNRKGISQVNKVDGLFL